MTRMFIRHRVDDYDAWRREYDGFAEEQKRLGVQGESVHRDVEDDTSLTVIHDFASLEDARAFVESDDLKEAMGRAGVVGAPEIWFTEQA